jgi:hypothetical protein
MIRAVYRVPVMAAAAALTACTSLPDTGSFTAAAIATQQSTTAVGNAVEAEIQVAANALPPANPSRGLLTQKAKDFRTSWTTTEKSLAATVRYAESVEGIVAAGNEGRKSVDAVAEAIEDLAGGIGVPLAPAAAGAVLGTGELVYEQLARVRAARRLEESLAAAGPAIVLLQREIEAQINDAEDAFISAHGISQTLLESDFRELNQSYQALRERERETLVDLAAPPPANDLARLRNQLAEQQALREAFASPIAEYEKRNAVLREREASGRQLFGATRRAIAALGEAHLSMAEAVAKRRPVSVASLSGAVEEVRTLIEEWKAL